MRLVHASYKREAFAVLVVAAVGLAVSFIAAGRADAESAHAQARPASTTAVIPDGTYGAARLARGEYVVFEVRNRRIRNLEFQIQITCETSDMPGITEQRFFTSGRSWENVPISPAGKARMNWHERGNGRLGYLNAEFKFGVRDVANFSVIVPEDPSVMPGEGAESCNGVGSLRFRRGYELPPIPAP
ncbi:MAG TPA: hypothetical protein VLL27_01170 [Solirubrobacterales bacterium]|nr:hypothetical protein [Solirubrobacterales bacterium]